MRKLFLAAALLALLGCGGDRYELVSSEGNAYRLDRHTGEVVFIHGNYGSVVLMPSEKEIRENTEGAEKAEAREKSESVP